ncbi:BON domain-containing protein [Microbacterium profundi]|nr:BON domain-containing protein [Microbacterium profundi]MCE7481820.1 BON domain-containing protein [Microbacterium profundi]
METTTRTDAEVQRTVLQELQWTPDVDDAGIGVAVEDGTVALSGEVDSYSERLAAKHAALRVRGVSAVIDNLTVHSKSSPRPILPRKSSERCARRATSREMSKPWSMRTTSHS